MNNKTKGIFPGPECYCHGDRKEPENEITDENASGSGCEFVYAFNGKAEMAILSSYTKDEEKMIGAFGQGDPDATWRTIALVNLNGVEPDWESLDR